MRATYLLLGNKAFQLTRAGALLETTGMLLTITSIRIWIPYAGGLNANMYAMPCQAVQQLAQQVRFPPSVLLYRLLPAAREVHCCTGPQNAAWRGPRLRSKEVFCKGIL